MGFALLRVTRTMPGRFVGRRVLRLRNHGTIRIRTSRHRRWCCCETHQKSRCENECRSRAGFDRHVESPLGRRPVARRDPGTCPQFGEKWVSSDNTGQKLGNCAAGVRFPTLRGVHWRSALDASPPNQCYEPCRLRAAGWSGFPIKGRRAGAHGPLRQEPRSRLRDRDALT